MTLAFIGSRFPPTWLFLEVGLSFSLAVCQLFGVIGPNPARAATGHGIWAIKTLALRTDACDLHTEHIRFNSRRV